MQTRLVDVAYAFVYILLDCFLLFSYTILVNKAYTFDKCVKLSATLMNVGSFMIFRAI